jgi:hypothetical protein
LARRFARAGQGGESLWNRARHADTGGGDSGPKS